MGSGVDSFLIVVTLADVICFPVESINGVTCGSTDARPGSFEVEILPSVSLVVGTSDTCEEVCCKVDVNMDIRPAPGVEVPVLPGAGGLAGLGPPNIENKLFAGLSLEVDKPPKSPPRTELACCPCGWPCGCGCCTPCVSLCD